MTQAPMAICGQAVLAAATLCVQAHADVTLPTGTKRPISSFFVTIANTGERKSTADAKALWPVSKREAALRQAFEPAMADYANAKLACDKAREAATKKAKGDRAAIKAALDDIGPAPTPPLQPIITCPEPTYEGLVKALAAGQPSMGIFSSEGGQFIGGHGMTNEAKLRTAAGLSTLWDGESVRRVRGGDGVLLLAGRRVALHLMAQPDVAGTLLSDPILMDQGLLSRMLVSAPEPTSGNRLWREPSPDSEQAIKRYGARLLSILERPFPLSVGTINELEPPAIPFSPVARRLWLAFHDHIEQRLGAGGELEPIRGLANKLPEHAARLAAVIALIEDINATEISENAIKMGVDLAQHYAAEALRLFAAGCVNPKLRLAQRLLDWLHQGWSHQAVSPRYIYRLGPNPIRDKATASEMVAILADHGWLIPLPNGAEINGHHHRDAFEIVRPK